MAKLLLSFPSTSQLIPRSCRVPPTSPRMGRPVPSRTLCPAPNFPPFSAHCRAPHAAQILPLLSLLCLLLELGRTRHPARQPLTSNSNSHCEPCGGIGSQSSQASPRIRRGCRPKLVNVNISCQRDRCTPSVREMLVRYPRLGLLRTKLLQ